MTEQNNNQTKTSIANGVVTTFKTLKIAILTGIIWFIGCAVYIKLPLYAFTDEYIAWFEAEEILGYRPQQYIFNPTEDPDREMFDPVSGSMEISDADHAIVRADVIKQLTEDAIVFALIMIGVTFVSLVIIKLISHSVKWTKKYAD